MLRNLRDPAVSEEVIESHFMGVSPDRCTVVPGRGDDYGDCGAGNLFEPRRYLEPVRSGQPDIDERHMRTKGGRTAMAARPFRATQTS